MIPVNNPEVMAQLGQLLRTITGNAVLGQSQAVWHWVSWCSCSTFLQQIQAGKGRIPHQADIPQNPAPILIFQGMLLS